MHRKLRSGTRIGLFLLACGLATAAYSVGVLTIRVKLDPPRIKPGDKVELTIETRDGFERPLSGVPVKVVSEKGSFEPTRKPRVQGATDRFGVFKTVWQSEKESRSGPQDFEIMATRSGYIGQYPVTARVIVEAPQKDASDREKAMEEGLGEGGLGRRYDPRKPYRD